MDGLLVLHKPAGVTSRKVVDVVEQWFPRVRIGHAGTLDPLATGVLVLGLGAATRFLEHVQRMAKSYEATILLGATSNTDDADGVVQSMPQAVPPTAEAVARCLQEFVGSIDQVPPAHSAAHVDGRRAYALARKGMEVELAPRRVQIYSLHVLAYAYPELTVRVYCGKGTYIRSLARDVGLRLGCGGYIQRLARTQIGPFNLDNALPLEVGAEAAQRQLLPVALALAELPRATLQDADCQRLQLGQAIRSRQPDGGQPGSECAVFSPSGQLVGVARWDAATQSLRPHKILNPRAG